MGNKNQQLAFALFAQLCEIAAKRVERDVVRFTTQVKACLATNKGSLTNGSRSRVAGPKSGLRVQCRGRGSKVAVAVAVAGPISRRGGNDLGFEVTE